MGKKIVHRKYGTAMLIADDYDRFCMIGGALGLSSQFFVRSVGGDSDECG
jgi:hypothetical protein